MKILKFIITLLHQTNTLDNAQIAIPLTQSTSKFKPRRYFYFYDRENKLVPSKNIQKAQIP